MEHEETARIWSSGDLDRTRLPPLFSILFGTFQVLDKQIRDTGDKRGSYVDVGFGSDRWTFGGAHRFSVLRKNQAQVELRFESVLCNPRTERALESMTMLDFHMKYAMMLFRDGASAVQRGLAS